MPSGPSVESKIVTKELDFFFEGRWGEGGGKRKGVGGGGGGVNTSF